MEKEYRGIERRRFKRLKVSFIVIYQVNKPLDVRMLIGDKEINALMLDLSVGGMAILTNYNIPKDTILLIKFTLINPYFSNEERIRRMEIRGQVCYNIPLERGEHRLGIRFTQIEEKDKSIIADFINKST